MGPPIFKKLRALFLGRKFREELDEEMAFHIDCLTEDLVREGMDPREARREAVQRFGSQARVQEKAREALGLALVDEFTRNLRLTFRGMARSPLFAGTFVLTLALCIGFGTAVFSIVDAVLWRPLPYPYPDQLAHAVLYQTDLGKSPFNTAVDGRTWERIRDEGGEMERAVYSGWVKGVNLSTESAATYVGQQRVGAGYFQTLGVPPWMGREFEAFEDVPGGPPVAILSHGLWSRTFQEDPEILGRTIRLKGEAHTVVGVMPEDFLSPAEADVWTPLQPSPTGEGSGTNYTILVRVPRGMTVAEGDARLAAVEPPRSQGEDLPEWRFGLVPLDEAQSAGVTLPLMVLLGAIGLMLIVGCANLAGLQIARSLARRGEMATRQALGSGAGALVRQAMVENLTLGALGGLAGLIVAVFAMDGLETLVRSHFETWQDVRLDGRALLWALGLTAVATVLFGLIPVLQATKPDLRQTIVAGTRVGVGGGRHRIRRALLVGEVTMVAVLLFSAGLLVRSYGHLDGMNPGFDAEGVLSVQFSLDDARYAEAEAIHGLFQRSLDGVREIPGVRSAAVALTLPYERPLNLTFRLPGDGEEINRLTNAVYVTPGFFETLGIPLLQGRTFEAADRAGASLVAVANQAFVDTYMEGGSVLGTPLGMGFGAGEDVSVVGVVGNVLQNAGWGAGETPDWETPTLYLAADQASGGFLKGIHVWFSPSWVIDAAGARANLTGDVLEVFRQVDAELPVARMASLSDVMAEAFARERFEASFLIAVSAFALLLAGVGLYGIVAHEVTERRAEMGLRMALGASPRSAILTTGLGGLRLTLAGLLLGLVLAIPVGRALSHLIYGIRPYDPATLLLTVGILILVTGVASFLPASRVGRAEPAGILREG
jgi:predicted permease